MLPCVEMQAGGGELETIGRTKRMSKAQEKRASGLRQQREGKEGGGMTGSIDDSHQLTPEPWGPLRPRATLGGGGLLWSEGEWFVRVAPKREIHEYQVSCQLATRHRSKAFHPFKPFIINRTNENSLRDAERRPW